MIEQVLERTAPQSGRIALSVNRNFEAYSNYGYRVVADGEYAGCGPLAGIAAGLALSGAPELLCVPGDAPRLPDDLASRLLHARQASLAQIAYVDDGGGPQPLCCLISRSLLPALRGYLDAGGRTPREWFARQASTTVDFSDCPRWAWSLNTDEEWTFAEQQFAKIKIAR